MSASVLASCSVDQPAVSPTATVTASAQSGIDQTSSRQSPIALITESQGHDIFGTSDRTGTDSIDSHTLCRDGDSGTASAWAVIFRNETERAEKLEAATDEIDVSSQDLAADDANDKIAVRLSRYAQEQDAVAKNNVIGLLLEHGEPGSARYNPKFDAIEVVANAAMLKLVNQSNLDVEVIAVEGEIRNVEDN